MTFISLKNYQMLFNDAGFWNAFQNNIFGCHLSDRSDRLALLFAILLNSLCEIQRDLPRQLLPVTICRRSRLCMEHDLRLQLWLAEQPPAFDRTGSLSATWLNDAKKLYSIPQFH